jgi:predicted CXXCH cytochrome family protein
LLSLLAVLASSGIARSQQTSPRVADAKCAGCHAQIYNNYLSTPMANASGLAVDKLIPGSYLHQPTGLDYKVSLVGTQATLSIQSQHNQRDSVSRPLSFFLGSGHLGTTYLYSIKEFLFESPVAWYAGSHAYDMKPGLAEMTQTPPSLPMQSSCLRCHMSEVQASDTGTINRFSGPAFRHAGITCEACHGNAEKHLLSGNKSAVLNPTRLSPDQRDSICVSCHLEGDVSVERAGHSALNFRPGESISTYLAFYVYGGADPTSRGVSEVEQFAKSICKQQSGDAMSCTSCHDPHFTPDAQQRTAFFRGKCLNCHNQPQFASAHHPENQDCTSCHMPRSGAQNIPHVAWTDHRILRVPEKPKAELRADGKSSLAPIFSPGSTKRDLAMANYKAMLEGNQSLEPLAWEQLRQLEDTIANDKDALDALGVLSAERGDSKTAEQVFRRALEVDPVDLTALSNLGILQARQGNLNAAESLLQRAFESNQDVSGLAMNLARIECMAGDAAGARSSLEKTLIYNPGLEDVQRLLAQLSECGKTNGKQ